MGPEWGQHPLALVGQWAGWWAQLENRPEPSQPAAGWTLGACGQEWAPISHGFSLLSLLLAGTGVTRGEAETQVSGGLGGAVLRALGGPGGMGCVGATPRVRLDGG